MSEEAAAGLDSSLGLSLGGSEDALFCTSERIFLLLFGRFASGASSVSSSALCLDPGWASFAGGAEGGLVLERVLRAIAS